MAFEQMDTLDDTWDAQPPSYETATSSLSKQSIGVAGKNFFLSLVWCSNLYSTANKYQMMDVLKSTLTPK